MAQRAVVLLSGGADSLTCLAVAARRDRRECLALSFLYGQLHASELVAAREGAAAFGATHLEIPLDRRLFAGSALTGRGRVPQDQDPHRIGAAIPATYVPARNLVFLSLAAACAESEGADRIYIGVHTLDFGGYPDCRPAFLEAFAAALRQGTRAGAAGEEIQIQAPLLHLDKAEILRLGTDLGVDYSRTVSCYLADREGRACGRCDSCLLRARGFAAAGIVDPTRYQPGRAPEGPCS